MPECQRHKKRVLENTPEFPRLGKGRGDRTSSEKEASITSEWDGATTRSNPSSLVTKILCIKGRTGSEEAVNVREENRF